ncbi:MAG: MurR/RpiR family transcriptional regulator [Anaerolineales bacterium]|jgi:DNA-binding MurR/RpiR family transcriptional regulator
MSIDSHVSDSFEARIRGEHGRLSPSFELLAEFLLDSYAQAAFLTTSELAHALDIDPATVVRFAQRLGYPGYPELQSAIRKKVKQELLHETLIEPSTTAGVADEAMSELVRSLELARRSFPTKTAQALITELDKATRVVLLAEGMALPAASTLGAWLEAAGYTVHMVSGSPAQLAHAVTGLHTSDLVLALEVAGDTPFMGRALAEARKHSVVTAAIVATPSSEVTYYADMVLSTHQHPEVAVRQVLLEAMIYALVRMLSQARPGRFGEVSKRVEELTHRLITEANE